MECGTPVPIQANFLTLSNPDTAGEFLALGGAPVVVPPGVLEAVTAGLTPAASPTAFFSPTGGLGPVSFPTSSFGQNILFNQQQSLNAQQNIQPLSSQ